MAPAPAEQHGLVEDVFAALRRLQSRLAAPVEVALAEVKVSGKELQMLLLMPLAQLLGAAP